MMNKGKGFLRLTLVLSIVAGMIILFSIPEITTFTLYTVKHNETGQIIMFKWYKNTEPKETDIELERLKKLPLQERWQKLKEKYEPTSKNLRLLKPGALNFDDLLPHYTIIKSEQFINWKTFALVENEQRIKQAVKNIKKFLT